MHKNALTTLLSTILKARKVLNETRVCDTV